MANWPPEGLADFDYREAILSVPPGVNTGIVNEDGSRVVLIIATAAVTLLVSTVPAILTAGGGLAVETANPLILTWQTHGPLVTQAWYGRSAALMTGTIHMLRYGPKGLFEVK